RRPAIWVRVTTDEADNRCLFFLALAEFLEGCDPGPKTAAALTFAYLHGADLQRLQPDFASRTIARTFVIEEFSLISPCTALPAKLAAEKHQSHARGAADGLEPRAARLASCAVAHHR